MQSRTANVCRHRVNLVTKNKLASYYRDGLIDLFDSFFLGCMKTGSIYNHRNTRACMITPPVMEDISHTKHKTQDLKNLDAMGLWKLAQQAFLPIGDLVRTILEVAAIRSDPYLDPLDHFCCFSFTQSKINGRLSTIKQVSC